VKNCRRRRKCFATDSRYQSAPPARTPPYKAAVFTQAPLATVVVPGRLSGIRDVEGATMSDADHRLILVSEDAARVILGNANVDDDVLRAALIVDGAPEWVRDAVVQRSGGGYRLTPTDS
jgi:hypothetical protein